MDDLRILRSKLTIKRAMLDLLTKKPFKHITIKDISDKAMVGRSTFYHHYLDKYDLVDNLITDSLDDYEKTLHKRLTEPHVDIEHFLSTLELDSKTLLLLRQIESTELEKDTPFKERHVIIEVEGINPAMVSNID
ncbi:TetR/AcrR family transcriptional regulator [Staphylococcus simulans]|uniref:TetR/AcrR family transcriptional regulator n=1 Tax=Staphylococcus simulans TaxID=1286 RepID=UPI0018659F85|nr:TetR/AcrR family transcriptional regulator [Staphylococcus simulans]